MSKCKMPNKNASQLIGLESFAPSHKNEAWKYVCSIAELSFRRFFFCDEHTEIANVLTVVSCSTLHYDVT